MSFIDKFIKCIFPTQRKIVPFNSSTVPILTVQDAETDKTENQRIENIIKVTAEQDQK